MKWYKCKCTVCGNEIQQNAFEILQPQIYVCQFCRENARQMLAIKNFADEVNVKIDFGVIEENKIKEVKDVIFGMEERKSNAEQPL